MATLSSLVVKLGLDAREFEKGWKDAAATTEKSAGNIKKGVQGLSDVFNAVTVGAAAIGGTLYTFKKALDFASEGEKLRQTRDRYNALIDDIGASQSTLQGLVDITGKQVTNFDAMASAASLMELRLAESEDELQKHFEIVSRLKKPNEEFGTALENWSLLLANKSIPRLDSFGISGSRVRERWRELTKVVGDSEEAFKLAVFEEAETSMGRLGDAVPVSAFDQFDVQLQNLSDSLKVLAAEKLGPVVKGLNAFITTQQRAAEKARKLNEAVIEQSGGYDEILTKLEKVNEAYDLSRSLLGRFAGGGEIVDAALKKTALELLTVVDNYEEFRDILLEGGVGQVRFRKQLGLTMGDFYDLNAQLTKNVVAARMVTGAWAEYDEAIHRASWGTGEFTTSMDRATAGMGNYTPSAWAAAEGTRRFLEAEREAAREAANLKNAMQADIFGRVINALDIANTSMLEWDQNMIIAAEHAFFMAQKQAELEAAVRAGDMTWREALQALMDYRTQLGYISDAIANMPRHVQIEFELVTTGRPPDISDPGFHRGEIYGPAPTPAPRTGGGGGTRGEVEGWGGGMVAPQGQAQGQEIPRLPDVTININGGDPARVQQVVREELKRVGYRADSQARRR